MTIYEQVENRIAALIESGVLRDGEKIPSLRTLSDQLNVSVNSVREAYWRLENRHYIEAVPQSGYYVRSRSLPGKSTRDLDPRTLDPREMSFCHVYNAVKRAEGSHDLVQLGAAVIDRQYWPDRAMAKFFREAFIRHPAESFDYTMSPGFLPLREQIALRSLHFGAEISPEDIIITGGCEEAVFLSLMTLCKAGDSVAITSPVYFNFLGIMDRLGITPVEIPSIEGEGMNLDVLEFVLERTPVKAVFTISNYANPTGAVLSTERKKALLQLLQRHDLPLIEDDVYGDLAHSKDRPDTCKSHDSDGRVILCSGFSKTISPGLRLGWTAPGRYYDDVLSLKTLMNIGTPSLNQIATAIFLQEGGYEQHLRRMRQGMRDTVRVMRRSILECFPAGTKVSDPSGGFLLWVTLPPGHDTMELYFRALAENILIAPGCLFSRKEGYGSHMRLNAASWDARIERAIKRLGEILAEKR